MELSAFQEIKGRGREIIHWTCLIAKCVLYKNITALPSPLLLPLPGAGSSRDCVSQGNGPSGGCSVPCSALPTCLSLRTDKLRVSLEERAPRRSLGHRL